MKLFSSKKRVAAIGAVTAVTLVGGGVAYAYWTASGSGTGSAAVGTSATWWVNETGDLTAANSPELSPDDAVGTGNVQVHEYTVRNDGEGVQELSSVAISIKNADGTPWSEQSDLGKPACTASDFSVGGNAVGVTEVDTALAGSILPGASDTGTVTVQMINGAGNQDNCKGVTVPLHFSAS